MDNRFKRITNLKTYIVSGVLVLLGILLLIASETITFAEGYLWVKALISNLGSLFIASVSIALLWELFSKREFLDELLANTGLADEIRLSGITGISVIPLKGPDFSKIIRTGERLDIFVCYANTWRANYEEDLVFLAKKKNCRIRLIVPDPDNIQIMADLAKRFNAADADTMQSRIKQAITEYKALFNSAGNQTLDFSVWIHGETPVTSFYRFDHYAVITLYKHAKGRGSAPTIVAERGGSLYSYVEVEVDSMIKGIAPHYPLAVQIYP